MLLSALRAGARPPLARLLSSSTAAAAAPVKPRAVRGRAPGGGESGNARRQSAAGVLAATAASAGLAAALYVAASSSPLGGRLAVAVDEVVEAASAAAAGALLDPAPDDLTAALPDVAALRLKHGSPWSPTVVLVLEGGMVARAYDLGAGNVLAPRPGLAPALLALAREGAEVVPWSTRASAAAAGDAVDQVVDAVVAGADRGRWAALSRAMDRAALSARAVEVAQAEREGRPPRVGVFGVGERPSDGEKRDAYRIGVLQMSPALGREHCVVRGRHALLPLRMLPRAAGDVLLVTADPQDAADHPECTLLLSPFDGSGGGGYPPGCSELERVAQLVGFLRAAREARHPRAATATDFLSLLRERSGDMGLRGSSAAAGRGAAAGALAADPRAETRGVLELVGVMSAARATEGSTRGQSEGKDGGKEALVREA